MTIKYNRFALFPHTCSECGKSFWLEPYKRFKVDEYKVFGCITYITNICKECNAKVESNKAGDTD
jgi:hypothetical protein